jgi:hypothetical protein
MNQPSTMLDELLECSLPVAEALIPAPSEVEPRFGATR